MGQTTMRSFEIFLDVISESLDLAQLSARLGCEPSPGSHEKGEPRALGEPFPHAIWRLTSDDTGEMATLEAHCGLLRSRIPAELPHRLSTLPADCVVELNIAVFFDTATCTVAVPDACLELARQCGARLTISCYPSDFGSTKERRKRLRQGQTR